MLGKKLTVALAIAVGLFSDVSAVQTTDSIDGALDRVDALAKNADDVDADSIDAQDDEKWSGKVSEKWGGRRRRRWRPHGHFPHIHVPVHAHLPALCGTASKSAGFKCTDKFNGAEEQEDEMLLAEPVPKMPSNVTHINSLPLIYPSVEWSKDRLQSLFDELEDDEPLVPGKPQTETFYAEDGVDEKGWKKYCKMEAKLSITVSPRVKACLHPMKGELYVPFTVSVTLSGQCERTVTYKKKKTVALYSSPKGKIEAAGLYSLKGTGGIYGEATLSVSGHAKVYTFGGSAGIQTPKLTKSLKGTTKFSATAAVGVVGTLGPIITIVSVSIWAQAASRGEITLSAWGSNTFTAKATVRVIVQAKFFSLGISVNWNFCGHNVGFSLGLPSLGWKKTVYSHNIGEAKTSANLISNPPNFNEKSLAAIAEHAECTGATHENGIFPEDSDKHGKCKDPYRYDEDAIVKMELIDAPFTPEMHDDMFQEVAMLGRKRYPEMYGPGSEGFEADRPYQIVGMVDNDHSPFESTF